MIVREITAKSIVSDSKIYPYVLNPYVGCQHGCSYCYARYMKRFTRHAEPWGGFVDVKVNAAELLRKEVGRKRKDQVWISGVCDPYQPLEAGYGITRSCLEILADNGWPYVVQTRSPLVLRDLEIFTRSDCSVGFSIPTADDSVRRLFEPNAPAIRDRIDALKALKGAGIRTYAMIAPILPGAEKLIGSIVDRIDYLYVDRMNYTHADRIYRDNDLTRYKQDGYAQAVATTIRDTCTDKGVECRIVF
jgi:DNA repair photolyase